MRYCRPSQKRKVSPSPVPTAITARVPLGCATPLVQDGQVFAGSRPGSRPCHDIIEQYDIFRVYIELAGQSGGFRSQGKLLAWRRPSTTAPATPNPTAVIRSAATLPARAAA